MDTAAGWNSQRPMSANVHEDFSRAEIHEGPSNRSFGVTVGIFFVLLALAPLSDARIVYTPANVNVSGSSYYNKFDLNHDGIVDLAFDQGCGATTFRQWCFFM